MVWKGQRQSGHSPGINIINFMTLILEDIYLLFMAQFKEHLSETTLN